MTLQIIDKFFQRRQSRAIYKWQAVMLAVVFLGVYFWCMHEIYKRLPKKIKKMFRKGGSSLAAWAPQKLMGFKPAKIVDNRTD